MSGVFRERWKGPVATAVAYAIGAQVGFHLRFPPATTSILWPPNAILTTALLLVHPTRWWVYLLATLPAHLLVELPVVKPAGMVPLLFVTNCSEALIAAVIVRSFSDRPDRFDTLRRMVVFIAGAVLAAPALSSFLDATLVSAMTGERFWAIWATRVPANALTELTLVPPAVIIISSGLRGIREAPQARRVEAIVLSAATAITGLAVFGDRIFQRWPSSGVPPISLAFPLPFVLVAALRFGPIGASMSCMIISAILIWTGMNEHGPFATLPPADGVLAVQSFLIVEALPLMCLSAIVEERKKSNADLRDRLKFERLLSQLSREFVRSPTSGLSQHFETWLDRVAEYFKADEVLLLRVDPGARALAVVQSSTRRRGTSTADHEHWRSPILLDRLRDGTSAVLSDSVGVAAMGSGAHLFGGLAIRRAEPRQLTPDDIRRLRLIAEAFANVLARQKGDDDRVRAELEAQRSRAELAHVSRQRSMGELTASLAHELNQPLTGILGNAQAARRMLDMPLLDLEELKAALDDIIADDRRAAETILRIRKWLRKDGGETVPIDLNNVILEVATLLRNDAVLRNLSVDLRLSALPLTILGDPVELRQLILNLLLNAMDAVSNGRPATKAVTVESELTAAGAVHVSVQDSGDGVPRDSVAHIFEPFCTTKSNGMGMGLSIAKSIVESHHGSIWLAGGVHRGARFEFALPSHEVRP